MRTNFIIDVRSPREYAYSHIPNSLSFPVLNDIEYEEVGTLYRHNTFEAKRIGSIYICQNIAEHLKNEKIFHPRNKLTLYCARGGQRSKSFWSILSQIGFDCERIEGGYKTYRNEVLKSLATPPTQRFITLYGVTGCGKSELIAQCSSWSIDIEKLSKHYGSSFGDEANSFQGQPTNSMFENLLYEELCTKKNVVLIEGESKRLGKVILPTPFFQAYHNGVSVQVISSFTHRIQRIVTMYSSIKEQNFLSCIEKIKPYIKKEYLKDILKYWEKRDFENVASILIEKYYDRVYRQKNCQYTISSDDPALALKELEDLKREIQQI
ncbi:tRNA 2-selenouridine(34) synthase MnmH [Helicobacter cholecystus]|uniref:tRNA 2-selenouridine(34) synthase MnmH n=1 Tax=Helicobacter cholecystus TaxID=45498 RepID=A0A3D8IV88_9HELI|nr:tRNA 2-selenouridine(34) synthase MnmH [Helicobacter cholecystus]RDU68920.1 tRNA 2-selenouridine(34) synthase MnmH [Helicobacter cholecystus]VEJ25898.1 tRNA 2-selenouridine synthase [Helicobacter cholecystus]